MHTLDYLKQNLDTIQSRIGYSFQRLDVLESAFIHRSYVNENRNVPIGHNERLEFLGDAILGALVSDHLYRLHPDLREGQLSEKKARVISGGACALLIEQLRLDEFLVLGKGELQNEGKARQSLIANLFEAVLGAIYLDGGFHSAQDFFERCFIPFLPLVFEKHGVNWKAVLQDYSQKKYKQPPEYFLIDEEGPDHEKQFLIAVYINGKEAGRGKGFGKKEAERIAAKQACENLKIHS